MFRLFQFSLITMLAAGIACGAASTDEAATSPANPSPTFRATSATGNATPLTPVQSQTPPPDTNAVAAETLVPGSTDTSTTDASTTMTSEDPTETTAPAAVPARVAVVVDQPAVGTDVGKTLPQFEFTLIDGTKKSTAQLSSQGRPVFLFFFATW